MKKVIISSKALFFLVVCLLTASCVKEANVNKRELKEVVINTNVEVIEVDGCEYIYISNGNASWGSHKGNCKFCAKKDENRKKDSINK